MTNRFPLVAHFDAQRIIAWRGREAISARRYLADVAALAERLPDRSAVFNLCHDRYRFLVGFGAALLTGKVSLLPPAQTPEGIRRLQDYAADLFCLHDGHGNEFELPLLDFPDLPAGESDDMPQIPGDQVAAVLFTSGSTGVPTAHVKRWGALAVSSQGEAERMDALQPGYTIVGTVPLQHSFGFESMVLLTLHSRSALSSEWPFYPADISAALDAAPAPRLLVTTPYHLRTLLDAGVDLPRADRILSATAPLSEALAQEAEHRLGGPVHEIYGCTETGQLASRRTIDGPRWLPLPGVRLEQEDGLTFALGGNGGVRQLLGDVIELHAEGDFSLQGRNADMVNIAGKRTSLAYLDHQLQAIDGVVDGCFFIPEEHDVDGITRLAAFVVAPGLSAAELRAALRPRIDPLFLPRPTIFLDKLPRNATGKLPRTALVTLFAQHQQAAK